jgi:hypothetical protein
MANVDSDGNGQGLLPVHLAEATFCPHTMTSPVAEAPSDRYRQ